MTETLFTLLRAVAWKVADRALVLVDWDGFCEACLPGGRPAGLLRWCARAFASLGLCDAVWWLPYLLTGLVLGGVLFALLPCRRRRWLPVFLLGGTLVPIYPLWTFGTGAWSDPEPASALMNALGLLVVALLTLLGRRVARGPRRAVAFTLGSCLLFPFFGLYALLAGTYGLVALLRRRRWALAGMASFALAGTLPLASSFLYGSLALSIAVASAHAFRTRFAPPPAIGPTLAMERRVREGDWTGVMAIAEANRAAGRAFPLRMEIAYRVLAQFHLGRLPDDLFRYPIRTCYLSNDVDEMFMDGHLLYFGYGLLLPARREIFERSAMSGLEPGQLRLLGDIALVRHEMAMAFRYYAMLARCPFREEFAARRIRFLNGVEANGADDLRAVGSLAAFWRARPQTPEKGFYVAGQNAEVYAYSVFRALGQAPLDLARQVLTVALLSGDDALIAQNLPLLAQIYPSPNLWPDVIREALLLQAARLDAAAREKLADALPAGVMTPAVEARFNRFLSRANSEDAAALMPEFGDTYYFYRSFVVGGGQ